MLNKINFSSSSAFNKLCILTWLINNDFYSDMNFDSDRHGIILLENFTLARIKKEKNELSLILISMFNDVTMPFF